MAQAIPMFSPGGNFQPTNVFTPQPPPFQPATPSYNPVRSKRIIVLMFRDTLVFLFLVNTSLNTLQHRFVPPLFVLTPKGVPEFFSPVASQMAGNMLLNMGTPMLSQTQQAGERWFSSLKYYFTVDNLYVWHKLKMLLLPINKNWNRQMNANSTDFLPPNQDRNAPDLYIPLMAFVTYVLLIAFFKGTNNEFTPDVIGMTTTTAFLLLGIEMLLVKAGIWLLNFPNVAFLDVLSYIGYKFVSAVLNISTGLALGHFPFLVTFVLTSIGFSVFLARTLQAAINGVGGAGYSGGKTQSYFLIAIAALQFVLIYFFCYISFTSPFVKLDDVVGNQQQVPGTLKKEVADTGLEFGELQPSLLA